MNKEIKTALITGVTGQDGSYLSELLLSKGYCVIGVRRRSSLLNTQRIDHIGLQYGDRFKLVYGDVTDTSSLAAIIDTYLPDEIYHLAAQSHVAVSFEVPEYTAQVDGISTLRILDIIKSKRKIKNIKFYQASTSELFGGKNQTQLDEGSPMNPQSPYAAAKLYAFHLAKIYRSAFGIFASNGILFNHESPRRGENFVTKKIIRDLVSIKKGQAKTLILGNLYSYRDWGHAADYVTAMWLMLQQEEASDYVIATGVTYTVKDFTNKILEKLEFSYNWVGDGLNEKCVDLTSGKIIIEISPEYFRPLEVDHLLGNASKAREELNWRVKYDIDSLIDDMINYELQGSYDTSK